MVEAGRWQRGRAADEWLGGGARPSEREKRRAAGPKQRPGGEAEVDAGMLHGEWDKIG